MTNEKKIIPLKFDLMFKKVFADSNDLMPLKELLKCILDIEPKNIKILNSEIIGSSYYDKGTIVDIIVELEDKTKIGIEMNTNVNKYLVERNLYYMFKIISKDKKRGKLKEKLNKHMQINIDCEGKHTNPIMKYKLIEKETKEELTDKIEIIRVDLSYYVKKCYNENVNELDYKDKFIGMIGISDKNLLEDITKGEKNMEEIKRKVEDFSDDEEILGAYDAEEHRKEEEYWVMVDKLEQAEEKGMKNKSVETAKILLKENVNIELISKATGLSIKKIEELK